MLPRRDNDQAIGLAEAMRTAIGAIEVDMPRGPLTVSASLGCATLDEAGGSIDALIALADERLYAAKRAGRNRVYRSDAHAA
ncbi:diguanylate cyclase [Sphingomonas aurantiaca]